MVRYFNCSRNINWLPFAIGAAVLAIQPLLWLVNSWFDPGYDSDGLLVIAGLLTLLIWSVSSPLGDRDHNRHKQRAVALLIASTAIRLAGQLLGINMLGAGVLMIDIYALGLLLGLDRRQRPLSPGWLAVLFGLSLPLERVLQRLFGYGLQQLSADGACTLLRLGPDPVHCEGVRILLAGQDVLVDLPCSGARGLLLLIMLATALAALIRPSFKTVLIGLVLTLIAALIGNSLRISILALGLAYQTDIDVMAAPWHELIGLLSLLLAAVPVLLWAWSNRQQSTLPASRPVTDRPVPTLSPVLGLGFMILALVTVSLPSQPIDIARPMTDPTLPTRLGDTPARMLALSGREQAYFTRYGGGATLAGYGPLRVLSVTTTSPLRHLHAPDECLIGAGHQVRYIGLHRGHLPSAVYRSIAPDGRHWRVAVTFISDRGEYATSVAEAVWHWLQNPGSRWTQLQRVTPWNLPLEQTAAWDRTLARALDLPSDRLPPALLAAYP